METLTQVFDTLEKLGFQTPVNKTMTVAEIPAYFEQVKKDRPTLDYDIDGIVVSVDNLQTLEDMGLDSGKLKPKGQIAIKFPAQGTTAVIRKIVWSFEGGSSVTPVAVFDPINFDGAEVCRASLKSLQWMSDKKVRANLLRKQKMDVTKTGTGDYVGVGTLVELIRSGDVIPKIEGVLDNSTAIIDIPRNCPICGAGIVNNGANLACENYNCFAKIAYRLNKFLVALGVKGLAHKSLIDYAKTGVDVIDLFDNLTTVDAKIRTNPNISLKIWAKVRKQIEEKQNAC